jgi:hypothetical protein
VHQVGHYPETIYIVFQNDLLFVFISDDFWRQIQTNVSSSLHAVNPTILLGACLTSEQAAYSADKMKDFLSSSDKRAG